MPRGHGGGGGRSRGMASPRVLHAGPVIHRRRPVVYGGGYIWNGIYWVSPQGACYTKDDEGVYTLVDCSAEGTGGTMDSSSAEGVKGKSTEKSDMIKNIVFGAVIGLVIVYIAKKYKLCKCFG